jgi:ABC-2 type transport system ATP-binding protein
MKQKISVIGALVHEPKLWVLDEPLTGLDPQSSYQLKKVMKRHAAKGNTVFFSSHILDVVENLCDRCCIINHGRLQGIYDLKELKRNGESLERIFMDAIDYTEEEI